MMNHHNRTCSVIALFLAFIANAAALPAQTQPAPEKPDARDKLESQNKLGFQDQLHAEGKPDAGDDSVAENKPDAPTSKLAPQSDQQPDSGSSAGGPASTSSSSSSGTTQEPTGPPSNPTGQQDENPKRILGIIPNFETKDDTPQNQPPLTVKEKYTLAWHQTVDFSAHFGNLFQAMLQQASNGQPHYGQGWGPYAERFGAAEGDQVTSAFFIFGFIPHILHDDPRYFRKAKGSVWSRITYSASRTVITRTDAGNATFNVPQVAGQLFQQSISTAYYPPVDRTAGRVFQNWGVSLAYNSAYNVLKEFYPDFLRIVFRRHREQDLAFPAPPPTSPPVAPPANH
jgi:hypothetical protein